MLFLNKTVKARGPATTSATLPWFEGCSAAVRRLPSRAPPAQQAVHFARLLYSASPPPDSQTRPPIEHSKPGQKRPTAFSLSSFSLQFQPPVSASSFSLSSFRLSSFRLSSFRLSSFRLSSFRLSSFRLSSFSLSSFSLSSFSLSSFRLSSFRLSSFRCPVSACPVSDCPVSDCPVSDCPVSACPSCGMR